MKQRFRQQRGTIVERSDGFYIRFYRDSAGERVKVTERLCDSTTSPATVKLLCASHMSAVNNRRHTELNSAAPAPIVTVGAFWQSSYLPWVRENKRASTARGYESDWKMYVKPELETTPLSTFTTVQACELLDRMATVKNLNESTIAHVKSLCSGLFKMAVRKGLITINPWREAEATVKVRKAKKRVKYTPQETIAIFNALEKPDAKLFFALCGVMGMRPSEAAAAKWEHMNWETKKYHVCEAAPYGVLGETKTEQSVGDVSVIEPAFSAMGAWYEVCGKPAAGLMFTNGNGGPVDHTSFDKYHIRPLAKQACARYCGLYAGRHGAATALLNLTGDIRATYQTLRNTLAVVMSTYVEPDVSAGEAGMGKYADALKTAGKP
jgi:integrase